MIRQPEFEDLETILDTWARKTMPDWPESKLHAFEARLGWRGLQVPTLQETGDLLGITRQSASEAERSLLKHLSLTAPPSANRIAEATALIASRTPTRLDRLSDDLMEAGLSTGLVTIVGLLRAADLAAVGHQLSVTGSYVHRSEAEAPPIEQTIGHVKRVCRAIGVCSLTSVLSEIGWSDRWDPRDLARDLENETAAEVLAYPWVSTPVSASKTNALLGIARRMLSVADSVTIEEITSATRRRVRAGRMPFSPPMRVVGAYFDKHPAFHVDMGRVSTTLELRPDIELGTTDLFIYQTLSADPAGSCTRTSLVSAAASSGIGSHAIAFALSISPIVKHVGRNTWALVGGEALANDRGYEQTAKGATHDWDINGHLVITAVATSPRVDRIPIPRAVRSYLRPGQYAYEQGSSGHTLKVNAGYATGIAGLLDRPVMSGDRVRVLFDIADRSFAVEVVKRELE